MISEEQSGRRKSPRPTKPPLRPPLRRQAMSSGRSQAGSLALTFFLRSTSKEVPCTQSQGSLTAGLKLKDIPPHTPLTSTLPKCVETVPCPTHRPGRQLWTHPTSAPLKCPLPLVGVPWGGSSPVFSSLPLGLSFRVLALNSEPSPLVPSRDPCSPPLCRRHPDLRSSLCRGTRFQTPVPNGPLPGPLGVPWGATSAPVPGSCGDEAQVYRCSPVGGRGDTGSPGLCSLLGDPDLSFPASRRGARPSARSPLLRLQGQHLALLGHPPVSPPPLLKPLVLTLGPPG